MKIVDNIRFPHPVLSEQTNDFLNSNFNAEFEYVESNEEDLIIKSTFELNSTLLISLQKSQHVGSGYYVVSQDTYFNKLQEVPLGNIETPFSRRNLFGTIVFRPLLWTKKAIRNIRDKSINSEFGNVIDFPKGTIVALGSEYRMSIDPARFRPFEKIFELLEDNKLQEGEIKVDTEGEKIKIIVSSATRAFSSQVDLKNGEIVLH